MALDGVAASLGCKAGLVLARPRCNDFCRTIKPRLWAHGRGGGGECCGVTLGSTEEECRQSGASRTDENNQGLTLKGENIMRWRNMLVVCTVKKKKGAPHTVRISSHTDGN